MATEESNCARVNQLPQRASGQMKPPQRAAPANHAGGLQVAWPAIRLATARPLFSFFCASQLLLPLNGPVEILPRPPLPVMAPLPALAVEIGAWLRGLGWWECLAVRPHGLRRASWRAQRARGRSGQNYLRGRGLLPA